MRLLLSIQSDANQVLFFKQMSFSRLGRRPHCISTEPNLKLMSKAHPDVTTLLQEPIAGVGTVRRTTTGNGLFKIGLLVFTSAGV